MKKKWGYSFNLTYSVTLDTEGLETGMVVRNTGGEGMEFQVLFHGYWSVDVSTLFFFDSLPFYASTMLSRPF